MAMDEEGLKMTPRRPSPTNVPQFLSIVFFNSSSRLQKAKGLSEN